MLSGRNFARFTLVGGTFVMFGVIRPGWGVEGGDEGADRYCCCYTDDGGSRYPGSRDWEGMQDIKQGDRIGMLLDLDQGSMTAWKNDVRLGVMHAEGLRGPLCWAVTIGYPGASVRIADGGGS